MSFGIIQTLIFAAALVLSGAALTLLALQMGKLQNRIIELEKDFTKNFERKPLLTQEEQEHQITYKEAIRFLKTGQSVVEISEKTGVSTRELKALSDILSSIS